MLLSIKNLKSGYGDIEVLRGVSIEVGEGEIVCLIGPNGAGKTTVLKSVMGLATKTGGEILWKGRDISKLPTHALLEEGIGFVPQGRLVFPSLTVRENLEMGGYLLNHRETREKNLESVLGRFPALKKYAKTRAGSLSGGEQQMLAIGRALMMTPELLMLDEPSLGLSPKITEEVYEKLMELHESGTILLIVEQNVRLVLRHASRGYLLSNGEVRFAGTAKELGSEKIMHEAYLL
ncbi:MAG: ABC transporter ATP-binding protein [Candidatus Liptonbacteria bacterium]|nr:ABC transporter ATP-binding protein [Candidatus Liptonbacteria bacterium]